MNIKIGHGYDVHAFAQGRKLILGGVDIPHSKGLLGHSDADVLLHAVCDAVLGALGKGDIGKHFPDTDADYAGADSRMLLGKVVELMQAEGYAVNNLDATIIAQAPKLSGFIDAMKQNVAADLAASIDSVNIKATTTEKLGFAGREEGIACHAVTLLVKESNT